MGLFQVLVRCYLRLAADGLRTPCLLHAGHHRWVTEQLVKDYSTKNNHDQFVRAWKELGRYTPEVRECVEKLKDYGITPLGKEK